LYSLKAFTQDPHLKHLPPIEGEGPDGIYSLLDIFTCYEIALVASETMYCFDYSEFFSAYLNHVSAILGHISLKRVFC